MPKRVSKFVGRIAYQWSVHGNSSASAAVAYYALFTLAPVLVFATAIAGHFVTPDDARALTHDWFVQTVGPKGAELAGDVFASADFARHGTFPMIVSGVLLLYGASSSFAQLRTALDTILGIPERTTREEIVVWLLGRLWSAAFVLGLAIVAVGTVIGTVYLHMMVDRLAAWSRWSSPNLHLLTVLIAVLSDLLVLLAVFTMLPSQHPPIRRVWVGAVVAVALLEVGKWIFGFYIARSIVATAYGPSSAIVAAVVWIYYSAQIILLGAEINAACNGDENTRSAAATA